MSPFTGFSKLALVDSNKRLLAGVCFGAFALLCVAVMFHAVTMSPRGILLYMLLPTVASGTGGCLWGGTILDRAKMNTVAQALLRGIAVAAGAFVILCLLYVLVLPLVERGWSLRQSTGLLLLTVTFGILLAGPLVLFGGMLGAASLYWFRRRVAGE